jgi:AcrR family transcriptional regulator
LGRPLGFDRTAALDQLVTLFWDRGYEDVNQQQMAEATGLSTSSLYNSFGTKPETYREVLARYADLMAHVLEPLEHGTRGRDDLHATLDRIDTLIRSPRGAYGCLLTRSMMTLASHDEKVAEIGSDYRQRLRTALSETLTRGRGAGEPLPDPDTTARVITAALLGTFVIGRAAATRNETIEHLAALHTLIDSWA